jgi:hypothetical protein
MLASWHGAGFFSGGANSLSNKVISTTPIRILVQTLESSRLEAETDWVLSGVRFSGKMSNAISSSGRFGQNPIGHEDLEMNCNQHSIMDKLEQRHSGWIHIW